MSLEYIRETYNVPAKRGGRVRYTGNGGPIDGTITSAAGAHLRVRFDDRKITVKLHPTWQVEYLTARTIPGVGENNGRIIRTRMQGHRPADA